MRRVSFAIFSFFVVIFPAAAADPSGIINFFIDQAGQAIDREQQRQNQKQWQQQNQEYLQIIKNNWNTCFNSIDVSACDTVLGYPNLNAKDRQRVMQRRAQNLNVVLEQQAQAREAENQRARDEAEGADRLQQADLERQRQSAHETQRAEAEQARIQAEVTEGMRRAEQEKRLTQQTYQDDLNGCRKFDVAACDRARMSGIASEWDASKIEEQRAVAIAYSTSKDACKSGEASACELALTSPALPSSDRPQLAEWQRQTSPFVKAGATLSNANGIVTGAVTSAGTGIGQLPLSTQILSIIVAMMGCALFAMIRKQGAIPPAGSVQTERAADAPPPSSSQASPLSDWVNRISSAILPEAAAPEVIRGSTALVVVDKPIEKAPAAPIDTPAAFLALKLAHAYLDETADASFSELDAARAVRTTLSLASRQMDIAHAADPNARFEYDDGIAVSQEHLRARILCQEALSWSLEKLHKAATIAERATIADPNFANAFLVLGMLQYDNRNKAAAIAALTKAVALDPGNIESKKHLDRAQNMGAAEIATFKATKAGVGVANAGIKVYNAGVYTRNFFVIIWNIFVTIWNIISFPMRIMDRIFGFLFGARR